MQIAETDVITDAFINKTSGLQTNANGYVSTEYIAIDFDPGAEVELRCTIFANCAAAFYDSNKTTVALITADNVGSYGIAPSIAMQRFKVIPPTDAAFVRLSANYASQEANYTSPSDFLVSGSKTSTFAERITKVDGQVDTLEKEIGIVDKFYTVNFTEDDIVHNAFISGYTSTNGNLATFEGFVCTQFVPVDFLPGEKITMRCVVSGNAGFAFYNKHQECILSVAKPNAADYGITESVDMQTIMFVPPEGTAFIRMSGKTPSYTKPSDFALSGIVRTSMRTNVEDLMETEAATKSGVFSAKILILGDSISADYYGNYPKWVTHLIETGFFSIDRTTNDSIHATGFVATASASDTNNFINRIEAITNSDSYDLVVVFGGINDYIKGIPFGESGGDKTTHFVPAVDYFFEYLVNNFTQARIAIISPLRTSSSNAPNGKTQTDYADYIKSVAKSYSLPVLNLTDESGFCPSVVAFKNRWTLTEYEGGDGVTGDGVHPNEEYERGFLAPMIRAFLQSVM